MQRASPFNLARSEAETRSGPVSAAVNHFRTLPEFKVLFQSHMKHGARVVVLCCRRVCSSVPSFHTHTVVLNQKIVRRRKNIIYTQCAQEPCCARAAAAAAPLTNQHVSPPTVYYCAAMTYLSLLEIMAIIRLTFVEPCSYCKVQQQPVFNRAFPVWLFSLSCCAFGLKPQLPDMIKNKSLPAVLN